MMGRISPVAAPTLSHMRSAIVLFALVGIAATTTSVQADGAQDHVEKFLGSWKGRWYSNGRNGSAKWIITTKEGGSIDLSAVIYTPGGRVDYTFDPQFNPETDALDVNDDPSDTIGTITVDGDNLRFDYRRKGRNGYYKMKKK